MISGENIRIEVNSEKNHMVEFTCSLNSQSQEKEGINIELTETKIDKCQLGRLKLTTKKTIFDNNVSLSTENAIRVYLPHNEAPEKINAMYMLNDWWTRPAFIEKCKDIPARTQIAYFKYPNKVVCFVPMIGKDFKSILNGGTEKEIGLDMSSFVSGQNHFDEPIYLISEGSTYYEAVHWAFEYLAKSKNVFTRNERQYPEIFEYLGWCSWDAMRTDANEEGIRNKASEFVDKKIPVRWILIDDGWFPGKDGMINGFLPDTKKFPNGFKQMIKDIKNNGDVKWFGVWHALPGYWNGVVPESELAQQEAPYLYETKGGYLVPSPENGSRFYYHWNEVLRSQGINFLKVDGQSSVGKCYKGSLPICEAARCMNRELELGACLMNRNIINCMGMAMENVLGRPTSGISRNSDDFITDHKGFVEHLLQNAYNSIYHDEIYHCDWDMFWTKHEHAVMHSMLRAISGGPIYFSDKVGDSVPKILEPLVYLDGRILRMDRSAKPTDDCLFVNPLENGVLKLHNVTSWGSNKKGGIISAHNITKNAQKVTFKPMDIFDLEVCENYWVYDYLKKKNLVKVAIPWLFKNLFKFRFQKVQKIIII